MKKTARLFYCRRCTKQIVICSHCDRGNIYCGGICAKQSRLENHRRSNQLYQSTYRGKQLHALRQKYYRERQKEKVTDQSSNETPTDALLSELKIEKKTVMCCDFCHAVVSDFLRNDYLSHSHLAQAP